MTKWEYCIYESNSGKIYFSDRRIIEVKEEMFSFDSVKILGQLGQEGWELVSVLQKTTMPSYVLKRPLQR